MTPDLPIHPRARRRLEAIVASRNWAPAYLLAGSAGSGLERAAAWLAGAILCTDAEPPCGRCLACRQVADHNHPDLARFAPAEAKRKSGKEGPIDVIRRMIAHLALRPTASSRQVVLLDGVDRLAPPAANALLKTLEEPLGGAVLILTVRNPTALLSTIVSRCQEVRLPLPDEAALAAGGGGGGRAEGEARLHARVAAAQIGEAARLAPERLATEWQVCSEVWRLLVGGDPGTVIAWVDQAVKGRDAALDGWLAALGLWLRDGMLLAAGRPEEALAFPEIARHLPSADRPPATFFEQAADHLLTAHRQLTANGQAKLVIGELLLTLQRDLAVAGGGGYPGPPAHVAVGRGR